MIYKFSANYGERLFYYFKRFFILLLIIQLVCVIAINNDAVLTTIFVSLLGGFLIASIVLERITRKTFPTVTIIDGMVHLKAGSTLFEVPAGQVLSVYCDVAFSLNFVPLVYSKGIVFSTTSQEIRFHLDKLSVDKVTNIQSLVEYYQSEESSAATLSDAPILIENKSLRGIIALCLGLIVVFWSYIGSLLVQEEDSEGKLLLCIGLCLLMIVLILLAHSNSLVKIVYDKKLYLTTLLGKQITFAPNDILKVDTQKASRAGENRVHYLNIRRKDGKPKKYKILLSSEEEKAQFHRLSECLTILMNNREA